MTQLGYVLKVDGKVTAARLFISLETLAITKSWLPVLLLKSRMSRLR